MQYEVRDQVAYLTFDRPARANALDVAGWEALRDAFQRAAADATVHVVILAGGGKHFCAGIDLSVLPAMMGKSAAEIEPFIRNIQDCITAIESCGKPIIAAVHGGCIGGGVDIVTACDMRYCTVGAYFTVKEVDLGIVADIGTLQRLPKILQPGLVAELAFTGRKVHGLEAERIGLVNATFETRETMLVELSKLAGVIAQKPPRVIRGIKENLLFTREHPTEESLAYVAKYSAGLLGSP